MEVRTTSMVDGFRVMVANKKVDNNYHGKAVSTKNLMVTDIICVPIFRRMGHH